MDKPRTLFGHPIRAETTAAFYPDRLALGSFEHFMDGGARGYATNMRAQPSEWSQGTHYIEEWVESWLAWSEIEEER